MIPACLPDGGSGRAELRATPIARALPTLPSCVALDSCPRAPSAGPSTLVGCGSAPRAALSELGFPHPVTKTPPHSRRCPLHARAPGMAPGGCHITVAWPPRTLDRRRAVGEPPSGSRGPASTAEKVSVAPKVGPGTTSRPPPWQRMRRLMAMMAAAGTSSSLASVGSSTWTGISASAPSSACSAIIRWRPSCATTAGTESAVIRGGSHTRSMGGQIAAPALIRPMIQARLGRGAASGGARRRRIAGRIATASIAPASARRRARRAPIPSHGSNVSPCASIQPRGEARRCVNSALLLLFVERGGARAGCSGC